MKGRWLWLRVKVGQFCSQPIARPTVGPTVGLTVSEGYTSCLARMVELALHDATLAWHSISTELARIVCSCFLCLHAKR